MKYDMREDLVYNHIDGGGACGPTHNVSNRRIGLNHILMAAASSHTECGDTHTCHVSYVTNITSHIQCDNNYQGFHIPKAPPVSYNLLLFWCSLLVPTAVKVLHLNLFTGTSTFESTDSLSSTCYVESLIAIKT